MARDRPKTLARIVLPAQTDQAQIVVTASRLAVPLAAICAEGVAADANFPDSVEKARGGTDNIPPPGVPLCRKGASCTCECPDRGTIAQFS